MILQIPHVSCHAIHVHTWSSTSELRECHGQFGTRRDHGNECTYICALQNIVVPKDDGQSKKRHCRVGTAHVDFCVDAQHAQKGIVNDHFDMWFTLICRLCGEAASTAVADGCDGV